MNLKISDEEYLQDKRLIYFTYNKFFSGSFFLQYKEDMIQYAFYEMYRKNIKGKYTSEKGTYATFIIKHSKFHMMKFLKNQKILDKNNMPFLSLDSPVYDDGEEQGSNLIEITADISSAQPNTSNFEYATLKEYIKKAISMKKVLKCTNIERYNQIILLSINGNNETNIAKKFNISRQFVSQILIEFRTNLKSIILKNEFMTDYELVEYTNTRIRRKL